MKPLNYSLKRSNPHISYAPATGKPYKNTLYPQVPTADTEMRTYIFTKREREALYDWIGGRTYRDQDTCLHTLLNRLTKNKQHLIHDIRLFILTQRKLGKRRLRDRRTQMTLTIAPIPIKPDPLPRTAPQTRPPNSQRPRQVPGAEAEGSRPSHTDSTSHPKPQLETGLQPVDIKQIATMSHFWPTAHTITTYYKVEVNTDRVKLDGRHREYRWINKMEDGQHPYLAEMIENTGLLK